MRNFFTELEHFICLISIKQFSFSAEYGTRSRILLRCLWFVVITQDSAARVVRPAPFSGIEFRIPH